ncbi:MAG: mevalonate kinase [Chlorobi bacterium]|nr:mevalonate kinase [Chlorobiota bacterium]
MKKKGPLYFAKILLFGEYGIIEDSQGLAIPYAHYKGGLKKGDLSDPVRRRSHENLRRFYEYLRRRAEHDPLIDLDFDAFARDLDEGLYFDSNIPEGYGVGSSGAIVAAVYERYARDKISVLENLTTDKLLKLKKIFAAMEDFFHGKSSGLDPLNSYLSVPILIRSKEDLEPTGIPQGNPDGKGAIFLIDSGHTGETGPMVQIFMEKLKNEGFRKVLKDEFIRYTNQCVQDFVKGNFNDLITHVRQLSGTVYRHFQPMIPEHMREIWKKGMESGDYYLKLCGSGGGGYILGFTDDFEKTKEQLKDYKLEVIYRF